MSQSEEEDQEKYDGKKFFADYAKSARSTCKQCKTKIEKNCLRLAKVGFNPFGPVPMKVWHHPKCLFESFKRQRANTAKIETPDDIDGWSDLEEDDQDDLLIIFPNLKSEEYKRDKEKKSKSTLVSVKDMKGESANTKGDATCSKRVNGKPAIKSDPYHKDNTFREFRRLCVLLSCERTNNKKTSIIKNFFEKGTHGDGFKGDLQKWVTLLLPQSDKREYNLSSKQIVRLFSEILHVNISEMLEDLKKNEIGESISNFFQQSKYCHPTKNSNLALQEVDNFLKELAQCTEDGDRARLFLQITEKCTANDLMFIIHLLRNDLQINIGPKHVFDALHPNAYEAFQKSKDINSVLEMVLSGNSKTEPDKLVEDKSKSMKKNEDHAVEQKSERSKSPKRKTERKSSPKRKSSRDSAPKSKHERDCSLKLKEGKLLTSTEISELIQQSMSPRQTRRKSSSEIREEKNDFPDSTEKIDVESSKTSKKRENPDFSSSDQVAKKAKLDCVPQLICENISEEVMKPEENDPMPASMSSNCETFSQLLVSEMKLLTDPEIYHRVKGELFTLIHTAQQEQFKLKAREECKYCHSKSSQLEIREDMEIVDNLMVDLCCEAKLDKVENKQQETEMPKENNGNKQSSIEYKDPEQDLVEKEPTEGNENDPLAVTINYSDETSLQCRKNLSEDKNEESFQVDSVWQHSDDLIKEKELQEDEKKLQEEEKESQEDEKELQEDEKELQEDEKLNTSTSCTENEEGKNTVLMSLTSEKAVEDESTPNSQNEKLCSFSSPVTNETEETEPDRGERS